MRRFDCSIKVNDCSNRVSDCSIRVSQFLAARLGQNVGARAMTPWPPDPLAPPPMHCTA